MASSQNWRKKFNRSAHESCEHVFDHCDWTKLDLKIMGKTIAQNLRITSKVTGRTKDGFALGQFFSLSILVIFLQTKHGHEFNVIFGYVVACRNHSNRKPPQKLSSHKTFHSETLRHKFSQNTCLLTFTKYLFRLFNILKTFT